MLGVQRVLKTWQGMPTVNRGSEKLTGVGQRRSRPGPSRLKVFCVQA